MNIPEIHRSGGGPYEAAYGLVEDVLPSEVDLGDLLLTDGVAGTVTMIDTFQTDDYGTLIRLFVGGAGGVIRSPYERVRIVRAGGGRG